LGLWDEEKEIWEECVKLKGLFFIDNKINYVTVKDFSDSLYSMKTNFVIIRLAGDFLIVFERKG